VGETVAMEAKCYMYRGRQEYRMSTVLLAFYTCRAQTGGVSMLWKRVWCRGLRVLEMRHGLVVAP